MKLKFDIPLNPEMLWLLPIGESGEIRFRSGVVLPCVIDGWATGQNRGAALIATDMNGVSRVFATIQADGPGFYLSSPATLRRIVSALAADAGDADTAAFIAGEVLSLPAVDLATEADGWDFLPMGARIDALSDALERVAA